MPLRFSTSPFGIFPVCPKRTGEKLDGAPPVHGAVPIKLGIGHLEIRSAESANAVMLPADRLRHIRALADECGLTVAALASPLWKWCRSEMTPAL
jgi:hypothetical protein